MTPNDLLRHYKKKSEIAKAGNVDRQVVQGWFERRSIPLEQQTKFEVDTDGKLRADVSDEFRKVVKEGRAAA